MFCWVLIELSSTIGDEAREDGDCAQTADEHHHEYSNFASKRQSRGDVEREAHG